MHCRNCDTEIDDNALICFRCGTATTEPVHQPSSGSPRRARPLLPILLGLVFLGVAGFFLMQVAEGIPTSPMVWVMLAAAGALLVYRLRLR